MKRSTKVLTVVLASTALAVAGCSDPTSSEQDNASGEEGAGGGAINIWLFQKPNNFSTLAPAAGADQQVRSLIFEGLMDIDPEGNLVPDLAESYEVSEDATTYTFTLRDDLTWSDGEPLTSEDVLFSYNTYADPATGSPTTGQFAPIEGVAELTAGTADTISGFSAPDESTFVFKTTEPNFGILSQVSDIGIMPEHILGDVPVEQRAEHAFWQKPDVGTGPFTFVEYKTDQYVHLVKNENHRFDVSVDDVYLKPVTSDVATAQLSAGEMDVVAVAPTDLPTIEELEGVTIMESSDAGFVRAMVNHTQPRFQDPRVSRAFLHAIDRQALIDSAMAGKGEIRNTSFGDTFAAPDLNPYEYDPAKAKSMLEDAGWDFSQPVVLLWIQGSNPDRDAAATVIEAQLNEIGVKLELQPVQGSELGDSYADKSFDMALFGGGNYETDGYSVFGITACDKQFPAGGNTTYFCDPALDDLIAQANATVDEDERIALYQQASAIDNEQVPYLWLYEPPILTAVSDRVEGYVPTPPNGGGLWEAHNWKITDN